MYQSCYFLSFFCFLGGGIELAAYILAFVFVNSFGRKYPLMLYLFLSGILCISVVCVRHFVPGTYVPKKMHVLFCFYTHSVWSIRNAGQYSVFCLKQLSNFKSFSQPLKSVQVSEQKRQHFCQKCKYRKNMQAVRLTGP